MRFPLQVTTLSLLLSTLLFADAGTGIQDTAVDTTNGPWTCHINDATDKVEMEASAADYDDPDYPCPCHEGDRIDLPSTAWTVSSGTLDFATGSTNGWTAGNSIGHKTLTVTFKDLDAGTYCDDPDVQVTKQLTAFKVGVHLSTTAGSSLTVWEDSTSGVNGVGGSLDMDHILISASHSDGKSTACTWTLKNNPAGTPMKQNIHGAGKVTLSGLIDGVTADGDYDVLNNGTAGVVFHIIPGVVSISYSNNLGGDDNLSLLAAGVGVSSELHGDNTWELELASETTTGPTGKTAVNYDPGSGAFAGDHGASKQAEIEAGYELLWKLNGSWAAAEIDMDLSYTWTIPTLPTYGP